MDSFDWLELQKGVEELGHGAIKFYLTNEDGEMQLVSVERVLINENEDEIEITLTL